MKKSLIATFAAVLLAALLLASCDGGRTSGPVIRLVLEPEEGAQVADIEAALDGVQEVIERRLKEFDVAGSEVSRLDGDRLAVELSGIQADEAVEKIGRTALLQFCEPEIDATGAMAVVWEGTVQYHPQTCDPVRDDNGGIVVEGGEISFQEWDPSVRLFPDDAIVWKPATAELRGVKTALTGEFLERNTFVDEDPILGTPRLILEWNSNGAHISGQVSKRLSDGTYPLAPFLDGAPIRGIEGQMIAPMVRGPIFTHVMIEGLSQTDAEELSRLLNTGPFPIPMRAVEIEELTD